MVEEAAAGATVDAAAAVAAVARRLPSKSR